MDIVSFEFNKMLERLQQKKEERKEVIKDYDLDGMDVLRLLTD